MPFFTPKQTLDKMLKAATKGDLAELAVLLRDPIHIHEITHDMSQKMVKPEGLPPSTPLHAAITSNHMACFLLLAQSMPPPQDPKAPDFWGRPPLLWAIAYNQSDLLILMMAMGFNANSVTAQHLILDLPEKYRENNAIYHAFKAYFEFEALMQESLLNYSVKPPAYGEALRDLLWFWSEQTSQDFFEFTQTDLLNLVPYIENLLKYTEELQKNSMALSNFMQFIWQSMLIRVEMSGKTSDFSAHAAYRNLVKQAKLPEKTLKTIETARAQAHLAKGSAQ